MHAKWEREIREMMRSEAFRSWLRSYNSLREELKNTKLKRASLELESQTLALQAEATQRLGDDRVFAAGESEDASARAAAAYANIENTSFEKLSKFELERKRATESWQEADRLEKLLEDDRQRVRDLRDRAEIARKAKTPEGNSEADRLESRARELQEGLLRQDKDVAKAREKMDVLTHGKEQLWTDVEALWANSFRAQMERSEYGYHSRRQRAEAESLFGQQAAERARLDEVKKQSTLSRQRLDEIQQKYFDVKKQAMDKFDCTLVEEFMFWPQHETVHGAWVLALSEVKHHLNIQVRELQLCQCDRGKGLDLIEPVPDEVETSREDARLESFFQPRLAQH
jgi:hypothetical protein